jgi:hypothetical protein
MRAANSVGLDTDRFPYGEKYVGHDLLLRLFVGADGASAGREYLVDDRCGQAAVRAGLGALVGAEEPFSGRVTAGAVDEPSRPGDDIAFR